MEALKKVEVAVLGFLEDGAVFEKAGINFSDVRGSQLPASATASRPQLAGARLSRNGRVLSCSSPKPQHPHDTHECPFFSC